MENNFRARPPHEAFASEEENENFSGENDFINHSASQRTAQKGSAECVSHKVVKLFAYNDSEICEKAARPRCGEPKPLILIFVLGSERR
jgi:hypothetical protein